MGVIYEYLKLPEKDKKRFLSEIVRQEAAQKLKMKQNSAVQFKFPRS